MNDFADAPYARKAILFPVSYLLRPGCPSRRISPTLLNGEWEEGRAIWLRRYILRRTSNTFSRCTAQALTYGKEEESHLLLN